VRQSAKWVSLLTTFLALLLILWGPVPSSSIPLLTTLEVSQENQSFAGWCDGLVMLSYGIQFNTAFAATFSLCTHLLTHL
jgi:hypothetical protein